MTEMETRLRDEETSVLQEKLRTGGLVDAAAVIAARVLVERCAVVPVPRTDAETDADERRALKRSTSKFSVVVLWVGCVWLFKLHLPENHYLLLASFLPVAAMLGLYRRR